MSKNQRFKIFRNRKKISQEDLAKKLDVSRRTIVSYEKDGESIALESLIKLREIYPELNIQWLVFGEGESSITNSGQDANNYSHNENDIAHEKWKDYIEVRLKKLEYEIREMKKKE